MRIGIGYDSHRFAPGRRLVLGGVEIPYEWGLIGHSDADAAAHAVTDAILGAAALGDIGAHFPPTDDRWKDADSIDLLARAARIVEEGGYRVANVDLTIICEVPRVLPYVQAMREKLAAAIVGIVPVDTVKRVHKNKIRATLPREHLVLAQTPQVFRFDLLKRAFESARRDGFTGTDESSLVERMDEVEVSVVQGSDRNIKITRPTDMELARLFLSEETQRRNAS
jgi:2-C-methyl-D-erythritol 2,4-cyclodiphosphate synthase